MEKVMAEANEANAFESEPLDFYSTDGTEGGTITELQGSTKLPADFDDALPSLKHILDALTSVRRAVPDAAWDVSLDETEVDWSPETGFTLPGL